VALGGCIVEKHFMLARADAVFSLEPDEFKRFVGDCRDAWRYTAIAQTSLEREGDVLSARNAAFTRALRRVFT
jgi:sialic acid synthase SpsE